MVGRVQGGSERGLGFLRGVSAWLYPGLGAGSRREPVTGMRLVLGDGIGQEWAACIDGGRRNKPFPCPHDLPLFSSPTTRRNRRP